MQCIIYVKQPDLGGYYYSQQSRIELFSIYRFSFSLHIYSHLSLININKLQMSIPHMLTIPNLSLQTCSILYGMGISAPWLINAYTTCLDRFGGAESSWTPRKGDINITTYVSTLFNALQMLETQIREVITTVNSLEQRSLVFPGLALVYTYIRIYHGLI